MIFLFWFSIFILFYIYFGYPLFLWGWVRLFPRVPQTSPEKPTVSILLSVFNEEKVIGKKIENLLSLDYPKEKLEILVGSDGSTDGTASILKHYAKQVIVEFSQEREGKARMLNHLAQKAKGEILVFTDARQRIGREAIHSLVRHFGDPKVGGVSGELFLGTDHGSVGKGLGFYWNYEKFIRKKESEIDSVIGATGALYAVRHSLYEPIPGETILDDLYLPMKIASKGYRILFEEKAEVYDEASKESRQEYERKVRTLAGNYQSFVQLSALLNPFRSRLALSFISHKLLRILAPFFLGSCFLSNLFLLHLPLYRFLFFGQLLFYGMAFVGAALPARRQHLFSVPYVFCLLNFSALVGLYRYLTGRQEVTWQKGNA